jgi:hypothetical protein
LAFDTGFWVRLAARIDLCKSDDDKAWFSHMNAILLMLVSFISINLTLHLASLFAFSERL